MTKVPRPLSTIFADAERKVRGYIKAVERRDKLAHLFQEAKDDVTMRGMTLTGGQLAQAQRILKGEER